MRIRFPFAAAFAGLVLLSAYVGLTPLSISAINDKLLHFFDFFLLTLTLYWALDFPRRFLIKAVLISIAVLAVGSEVLQHLLPNGRSWDYVDVIANLMGELLALALCSWYHKRMLERKRQRKLQGYGLVHGEDEDVELGESSHSGQELGVVREEDDDENGEAWDEIGGSDAGPEGDGADKDTQKPGTD